MNSTEKLPQIAILSPQQAWDTPVPLGSLLETVIWEYRNDAELHVVIVPGIKPCLRRSMSQPASTSQKQPASINQPAPINKPQPASINTPVSTSLPPIYIYRLFFCVATPGRCCALPLTFHPLLALRMQSWWPQGLTRSLKS